VKALVSENPSSSAVSRTLFRVLPFTGAVHGTYNPAKPPALDGSISVVTAPGLLGALGATGTVPATMR
jgi:hypothetical protein